MTTQPTIHLLAFGIVAEKAGSGGPGKHGEHAEEADRDDEEI